MCKQAFSFVGCQIEGMTTGQNYTQGFSARFYQMGIAREWLAPLKKQNRVLDLYKKLHIWPNRKKA